MAEQGERRRRGGFGGWGMMLSVDGIACPPGGGARALDTVSGARLGQPLAEGPPAGGGSQACPSSGEKPPAMWGPEVASLGPILLPRLLRVPPGLASSLEGHHQFGESFAWELAPSYPPFGRCQAPAPLGRPVPLVLEVAHPCAKRLEVLVRVDAVTRGVCKPSMVAVKLICAAWSILPGHVCMPSCKSLR